MDKEKFLSLEINNISQVYSGKRNCCRCGCGGEYISTTFAETPLSEINNELVIKRLKRAKRLIEEGADVDYDAVFVDVRTGIDRTLTFYLDELKPQPLPVDCLIKLS